MKKEKKTKEERKRERKIDKAIICMSPKK